MGKVGDGERDITDIDVVFLYKVIKIKFKRMREFWKWQHTPLILALKRQSQAYFFFEFQASMIYIVSPRTARVT